MMKQGYLKTRNTCAVFFSLSDCSEKRLGVTQRHDSVHHRGTVLADARGMTLYTFDKDMPDKSVCNDRCASLAAFGGKGRHERASQLVGDYARRWLQAMGIQRKTSIYVCRGYEAGRRRREWLFWWHMARCKNLML